ncbi:MAG: endonuclease/exonuclease/phosphatase family protein [Zavarzinella sp.]
MFRRTFWIWVSLFVGGVCSTDAQEKAPMEISASTVRVMSYNIRYGTARDGANAWDKRKDFLLATIQEHDVDLLGTQETLGFQRDFLAKGLPEFTTVGVGREDGKEKGEMTAVFFRTARFELLDSGHFWLSETPEVAGSKSWDSSLPRMVTWVKLRDRSKLVTEPILFMNTHFDHIGKVARKESSVLVRRKLLELGKDCRLILTGDFNSAENSEPYQALFSAQNDVTSPVQDSYRIYQPKVLPNEGTSTSTFEVKKSTGARIDWIACSPTWEVRAAWIDRTHRNGSTPSDHFAVLAVLRPEQKAKTLRVLTYNIHHAEGTDKKLDLVRIARIIRNADPDLVAVQEVDVVTQRTLKVDQAAELIRLTGLNGHFEKAIDFQGGAYGQMVLSRFPIKEAKVHLLPMQAKEEQRIAVETLLETTPPLRMVSTHWHHQGNDLRVIQAKKLAELLANVKEPIILAGDFNTTRKSEPLQGYDEGWSFATDFAPLQKDPEADAAKMIDLILYRPKDQWTVTDAKVILEPLASDHHPVLAVLQFK